jgi:hypothetical protein
MSDYNNLQKDFAESDRKYYDSTFLLREHRFVFSKYIVESNNFEKHENISVLVGLCKVQD